MEEPLRTSWQMIRRAADGDDRARDRFVGTYAPTIRRALAARWRHGPLAHSVDDALQDVFVECMKDGGVLQKAAPHDQHGFREYLAALVRNVARRFEARLARERRREECDVHADHQRDGYTSVSQSIDRDWARAVVGEAIREQRRRAATIGDGALRRTDLLHLRFVEGMSIQAIAERWELEPSYVHHQYAKARSDFRRALLDVLRRRVPGATEASVRARLAQLGELLEG